MLDAVSKELLAGVTGALSKHVEETMGTIEDEDPVEADEAWVDVAVDAPVARMQGRLRGLMDPQSYPEFAMLLKDVNPDNVSTVVEFIANQAAARSLSISIRATKETSSKKSRPGLSIARSTITST